MFTNRGSTISPTINKFNVQCVGYDNCHQLVFQVIVEFVETALRKNRHLANPLPCQKIQVIVIQGYSYFMNMQKCKKSLHLL